MGLRFTPIVRKTSARQFKQSRARCHNKERAKPGVKTLGVEREPEKLKLAAQAVAELQVVDHIDDSRQP